MIPPKLFACIVIPHFAAQALLRSSPEANAVAIIVMEGIYPLERVCSLTEAATALGLRLGMTRIDVEAYEGVLVLQRSKLEEKKARIALRNIIETFTPVFEELPCKTDWQCVADMTGTARLMGSPEVLGQRFLGAIKHMGLTARIVLCENADAGFSLARGYPIQVSCISKESIAIALSVLSVTVLQLTADQRERFALWGIHTLGELAALPATALVARMGQEGQALRLRARGELPEMPVAVAEELILAETLELEESIETLDPLLFHLEEMLIRLINKAAEHGLGITCLTLALWSTCEVSRTLTNEQEAIEDTCDASTPMSCSLPADRHKYIYKQAFCINAPATSGNTTSLSSKPPNLIVNGTHHPFEVASADAAVRKTFHLPALMGQTAKPFLVSKTPSARSLPTNSLFTNASSSANKVPLGSTEATGSFLKGTCSARHIRPVQATIDCVLLLKLIQIDLQAQALDGAITCIKLVAEAAELAESQIGLFAPSLPEAASFAVNYKLVVDAIGEDHVGRACPLNTHQADSFILQRFVLRNNNNNSSCNSKHIAKPVMYLRRFKPSWRVRVTLCAGIVEAFWLKELRYLVRQCCGPWKSSGSWWNHRSWSHDFWDIVGCCEDGSMVIGVLERDVYRDSWHLCGVYD